MQLGRVAAEVVLNYISISAKSAILKVSMISLCRLGISVIVATAGESRQDGAEVLSTSSTSHEAVNAVIVRLR